MAIDGLQTTCVEFNYKVWIDLTTTQNWQKIKDLSNLLAMYWQFLVDVKNKGSENFFTYIILLYKRNHDVLKIRLTKQLRSKTPLFSNRKKYISKKIVENLFSRHFFSNRLNETLEELLFFISFNVLEKKKSGNMFVLLNFYFKICSSSAHGLTRTAILCYVNNVFDACTLARCRNL